MKKQIIWMYCLTLTTLIAACGFSKTDIDEQSTEIAAQVFMTQTAQAPTTTPSPKPTETPTLTPTPAPTDTPIPTDTPTMTPTPQPELSDVALTLDDLPFYFEEFDLTDFETMEGMILESSMEDTDVEMDIFAFMAFEPMQFLMGFNMMLPSLGEQQEFDESMPLLLESISEEMGPGTEPGVEYEVAELSGLEGLGDTAIGVTVSMTSEGEISYMDMLVFRRGRVASMIWLLYEEGTEPGISLIDAAHVLDDRILEFFSPELVEPPSPYTLKIGLNIEITGDIPKVGEQSQRAAEMYVEENPTVEIGGQEYTLELIVEDNNATAEGAAAAANKLITQDNVYVLVGPNPSAAAVPAGAVANNLETPMISAWSTNPNTTLDRPWVFRVAFLDPTQGLVLANFATDEFGVDKACVLFDVASAYPEGLGDSFKSAWEDLHGAGSVVAFESFTTGNMDFSAQLTNIIGSDCDVLFTPQYYNEVPLIVAQAQELGIDIPVLGSDSWGDPQMVELCGDACNGYYFSTHYVALGTTGATKEFIDEYNAKYGEIPGDVAALTWDAMLLVVQALKNCGEISGDLAQDRGCIRDGMVEIAEFEGITGNMTFDDQGDPIKCAVIAKIENQEFVAYESACP